MTQLDEAPPAPVASRRVVLASAGAAAIAVLGGCATYDQTAPAGDIDPGGAEDDPAPTPAATSRSAGGGADGAPPALASTADIPVGGGTVLGQRGIVVTQPEAGTYKAFSAVCTHAGCLVAEVKNGTINCRCHGSKFKAADGSVAGGPANRALKPVAIAVTGTDIRLA